jgi:tetratricopeptide (TPR) repeat protein
MKLNFLKTTALVFLFFVGSAMSLKAQTVNDALEAFNKGIELSQADNFDQAIASYKTAIEIFDQVEPENENKLKAQEQILIVLYKKASTQLKDKKYDDCLVSFQSLIEFSTNYNNEKYLKRANGAIPKVYYAKGKELFDAKKYDEALVLLNKSIELDPNYATAYIRKAQIYDEKNKSVEFKETIDKAIDMAVLTQDTKSEEIAKQLGANFFLRSGADAVKVKKYDDAVNYFTAVFNYKEGDTDIYFQLAAIYNKQSKWDDAITAANKSLELFKEQGTTKDARIYFELGNAYVGKQDNQSACDAYKKANKGDYAAQAKYQIETVLKCK